LLLELGLEGVELVVGDLGELDARVRRVHHHGLAVAPRLEGRAEIHGCNRPPTRLAAGSSDQ